MFLTNDGAFTSNPITAEQGYLLLSCTGVTDILVLSEFATDTPYESFKENFDQSAGRSLAGALRVQGGSYSATKIWLLNFVVGAAQLTLFELMLSVQNQEQVTLADYWDSTVVSSPVRIDVDGKYSSRRLDDWLLQFTAREDA
jgi:hypothetical protein